VALGSLWIGCFRIVNHGNQSIAVSPEVEYHISPDIIGIFESSANLWEIVPPNLFDYRYPCFDLVRCIWVLPHGLVQMLARNDMHPARILHNM
jgi:hypothetical protein